MDPEQLLKDALFALNVIPNTRIFHVRYEKSYDVASAISKYFRDKEDIKIETLNKVFKSFGSNEI